MEISSDWLSRKLGYGFSLDEPQVAAEDWIFAAKREVSKTPEFNPWRFVARKPEGKSLKEMQLPDAMTDIGQFGLVTEDLRYPSSVGVAVQKIERARKDQVEWQKLEKAKKIKDSDFLKNPYIRNNFFCWWRDTLSRGLDNVRGATPVYNRFWHFWINHFSVNTNGCEGELFGNLYLTLRDNLTVKYDQLLFKAITSPALQEFLQNNRSVGPNSAQAKWNKTNNKSAPTSINENLGRELLELYTVSPKAGYSQDDVNGATYILTGWGQTGGKASAPDFFNPDGHEPGAHQVLGKSYNSDDFKSRLRQLCVDLAKHPLTAEHLAGKLARHFISDEPPKEAIDLIANAYRKTDGSLIAVHQAVIDAVAQAGPMHKKFVSPERWFWLLHRTTKQRLPLDFLGPNPLKTSKQIDAMLIDLGEMHSEALQPNGWPEAEVDWLTPEYLDRRIRFANILGNKLYDPYYFDAVSYAERILGKDHTTSKMVARAESYPVACTVLFCSDAFLRI